MKLQNSRRQFIGGSVAAAFGLANGVSQTSARDYSIDSRRLQSVATPYPESNAESQRALVIGQEVNPTSLNLQESTNVNFQQISGQIVEQLVRFSADGSSVEPWLAEDFSWVDDLTFEIRLKQGISFSNGEPFDARAAQFSIEQFAESITYRTYLPEGIYQGTEIIDDHTVQVHLNEPFAPFLSFLARGGAVFPPEYYQEVGAEGFGRHPIGTGPFVLDEWAQDAFVHLTRSDNHWNGYHPLQSIRFSIIPENTARLAALESGEIHLTQIPMEAVETLEASSVASAVTSPGLRKYALFFDTRTGLTPELDDVRVRKALNHAVDKQAIVDMVYLGNATPLQGQFLAEQEFGFNPDLEPYEYNPELAMELLAEAGFENGFEMQFTYRAPVHRELGEIVSSYLEQVGIQVNQRGLEAGAFVAAQEDETIGPHQQGLLLPPEPFFSLNNFTHGGRYEWHILDDEYTELVDQGVSTIDEDARLESYHQATQIAYDDPPMLFLIMPHDMYGVSNQVTGFEPRIDQVLDLYNVDLAE